MIKLNSHINSDWFDIEREIDDKSIDLIFTVIPDISQMCRDNVSYDEYLDFMKKTVDTFDRIIKDDGFIIMMQTDRKVDGHIFPKQYYLKQFFFEKMYKLYMHPIYVKNSFNIINLYQQNYANILVFTKNGKLSSAKRNTILRDVYVFNYDSFGEIDAGFANLFIEAFTDEGDVVLDPFSGLGGICKQARLKKRNFIAVELDREIYDKADITFKSHFF